MVINEINEHHYSNICTKVNKQQILGITWCRSIDETIKVNESRLFGQVVHDLIKYQNCFETLLARVCFLNSFSPWKLQLQYDMHIELKTRIQLTYDLHR